MGEELLIQPSVVSTKAQNVGSARRGFFSATYLAGSSMVLNVISIPVTAYIIRRMGDDRFGEWNIAIALVGAISMISNLGLRGTFVRAAAKRPEDAPQMLAQQLMLRWALSLLVLGLSVWVCTLLHYSRAVRLCAAVTGIGVIVMTSRDTLCDLLQGMHRISVYASINFVAGIVLTAASVVAAAVWPTPAMMAWSYVVGPVVSVILLAAYVRRNLFPSTRMRWNPAGLWPMLKDARFIGATQVMNSLSNYAEMLILPKLISVAKFGLFSGGLLLISRLVVVSDSLGSAFYPIVANAFEKDPKAAARQATQFLLLSLAICLPVAVGVSFISGPIAQVLFLKKNFDPAICQRVIFWTIWALPLWALDSVLGYSVMATHKDAQYAKALLYAQAVILIVSPPIIYKFVITGAIVTYLLRTVIKDVFQAVLFDKLYDPVWPVMRYARLLMCAVVMGLAMWGWQKIDPRPMVPLGGVSAHYWLALLMRMSVQGIVGCLVYAGALFAFGVFSPRQITELLSILKPRFAKAASPV